MGAILRNASEKTRNASEGSAQSGDVPVPEQLSGEGPCVDYEQVVAAWEAEREELRLKEV